MVAAGNVANELERSQRHDDDDDLFTSSIDTTSSVVSKGSKSKHKHKKKGRTDSQLSNASSKSAQKENKTASTKSGKCSGEAKGFRPIYYECKVLSCRSRRSSLSSNEIYLFYH